ncbi:neurotrypsin-like [Ruditapes philippinarum]|uniref:neurotrypsin-like n=1 Tax=Ruditapes philippinarum TaxID=129788 RepID=UPI00295BF8B9|nr:neurotrypsin-like [Ruditapes philippinarum]XP_060592416.1 neurotrypsin-like [Ruditapes philippinarum]
MLKYPETNPQVFRTALFGAGQLKMHLHNVGCKGNETSLFQCKHFIGEHRDCNVINTVGISCIPVRLANGSNQYEGRLELWHEGSWGTVCDDGFGTLSASVVCKMLDLPETSPMVLRSAHFGSGKGPIHLDNVKCTGKESSIHQCSHSGWGTHTCSHNDDVGISCSPGIRLVNGSNQYEGRLEVWHDGTWGTVCENNFGVASATVVCKMLNYPWSNPLVFGSSHFGLRPFQVKLDNVRCKGTETSIFLCPYYGWGIHGCVPENNVGISCTPVRLVGGSNQYEGRLEVWHDNTWGTVCDDNFGVLTAKIVCKMLTYPHINPVVRDKAFFGAGTLPILLDNVGCTGNETSLYQCPHSDLRSHDCSHTEDVGIVCK